MIFTAKPSVVGHRGYGAGAPGGYRENSVESFLAAAASGVPWVELDARRSSDGVLVLWHDPVTPDGRAVADCTAAELGAAGLARLDEVLSALPAGVGVNIDVKSTSRDATDPPARRTHALIARSLQHEAGTRPFLISSFDPSLPVYLRDSTSINVPLGLITSAGFPADHAIPAAANLRLDAICLNTATLGIGRADRPGGAAQRIIETAHRAGLEVMAWSPDPAECRELAQAGIDAVCVNDIPGVQAALADLR